MEGNPQPEESFEGFETYLNRQSDWLEKTKGNLMVTATVIAGMSFQVMVSPPGGIWQSDGCTRENEMTCREVGTAVFAHADSKRVPYLGMVISSTVSFTTSMSFILLAISVFFRLRNWFIMAILVIFMLAAVICLSAAFFFAIALVQSENDMVLIILICYVVFWVLFVISVVLIHFVRFTIRAIRCCCGRQRRSSRGLLPLTPSSAN